MVPPPTITHAPLSQPTVEQMPHAALLSALAFTLADLLCRSPLVAPRVSRFFARARAENERKESGQRQGDSAREVHRRAREQSLVAVVEDAGIKLVGALHVALCLPLAVFVLSEKRRRNISSSTLSALPEREDDPRLLLYSSTPASRLLVSLSSGYFLWDIVSILVRTYVAATPRGRREGRSVGGGFLAHGAVCCCLFGLGALTGRLSHFAATFLLFEASTPFVYLRWALSAAGEKGKESRAYTLCGLAMVSSFFAARIVFGVRFAAEFWGACLAEMRAPLPLPSASSSSGWSSSSWGPLSISVSPPLGGGDEGEGTNIPASALALCLVANLAMSSLNFFWFSKMLSGAVKHLLPSKERKRAGAGAATEAGASATAAAAAATEAAATTAAGAVADKEEGNKATANAATATHALNRRVFSVRSTSSGLEASEGKAAAAAALAPPTPERRVSAAR